MSTTRINGDGTRVVITDLDEGEVNSYEQYGTVECALLIGNATVLVPGQRHSPEALLASARTMEHVSSEALHLMRRLTAWAEQGLAARGGAA